MTRFDSATAVRENGEGRYTAELDPGYLIGTALNGGYLMAVMQRAVLTESAHPHPVSSTFHFLRPAVGGNADIDVSMAKTGRTVTTTHVALRQSGTTAVSGTIVSAALDDTATPLYEASPVDLPPIERCRWHDPRDGGPDIEGFAGRVELRFTPPSYDRLTGTAETAVPELAGYVRPSRTDGGPVDNTAFLPLAVDSLPPVVTVLDTWRWAPTVELTWHMRAVPEAGPLAFRGRAHLVSDGWFDETVDLWDSKGRLVAQSRQLARVGR